ncbi:MAG TPA: VOC family protein [Bacteroidales bacterium]|jgi:predicted enzyme related to lactoylglutathione lyase|nr:VOC family protein [Bacteroidales bacterium]
MKKNILIILALGVSFVLGFLLKIVINDRHNTTSDTELAKVYDSSQPRKVTGIGGIFFKCQNPEKVKTWYKTHLGFQTDEYGMRFEWLESSDTSKKGSTQWSVFNETANYFDPSPKDFMINYRVNDLEGLVKQLQFDGVTILDTMETYEYGKFIHILDIEGNKIELWEPDYNYNPGKK